MESVRINELENEVRQLKRELDITRESLRKYHLEYVFKRIAPLNVSVTSLPLPQHKRIQNNKYYWS